MINGKTLKPSPLQSGEQTRVSIVTNIFFYKVIYLFLFLAVLGLRCYAQAFSSCGEQGLLFVTVHGLLLAVASPLAEHGF